MKSAAKYIGRRQAMVVQGVAICPLLYVCTWDTGCEGSFMKRRLCWRQETTEEALMNKLEDASRGGTTGTLVWGWGSRRLGIKLREADVYRELGDVQVDL